jgi:hypothetical protein
MTKNMTRKGLALGAASALLISGFSALPASSAGLADTSFVSLAPTTGTEYGTFAAATTTFSMTANEAATVSVGNLKFLVTDAAGVIEPTIATTGRVETLADNVVITTTVGVGATDVVSIASAAIATTLTVGDKFYFVDDLSGDDGGANGTAEKVADNDTIFTVSAVVANTSFAFTTNVDLADNGTDGVNGAITLQVIREARHATNGTFVVDSGISSAATNETLVLKADGATSRSVTVQAWMDANGNDLLDSTEYASPLRTVTFTKPSELVSTVGMSPIPGDVSLTASISTTPVLNGQQVLAADADFVNAAFTRQGEATVMYGVDTTAVSTWSDVTKTFSVSVFMDADDADAGSSTVDGNTDASWTLVSALPQAGGADNTDEIEKVVVTAAGLVTITTSDAHNIVVGDKLNVVINGAAEDAKAASADADGVVVTSVPTALSLTYQLPSTTTAVAGTADSATAALNAGTTIAIVTWDAGIGVTDRVFAGTHTAKAFFAGVANGSTLTVGAVAAATASATIASTGSAVVAGVTGTTDVANDVVVKTGTTSAEFTVTVLNAAGTAVGAGRPVVLTTEAPVDGGVASGSFKINGLSSATVNTNALGQVVFTLTTTTSSNAAQTRVNAVAENLATIGMDVHWDDQAYTLVDYSTTAGVIGANAAIARTITSTGTYTLNLAVADQWFQAAPAASYRVVVTGSGVTEKIHTLNAAGRAPVVVTDAGIAAVGGNFTSSVALQKLTGTTWAATSTHAVTTTIAAAPTVLLGGDASTTYQPAGSALAVDLSDAVTLKALVEIDKRSSTTATPVYGVANASEVLVQGVTRNSTTSAALTDVYVTISGPNNILFSNGQVAARGSLTFLSDGTGEFEVAMYSTSAQKDSVITVTAMGSSTTTKVSFTGTGVGEGTSLVVTMPAAVKPASTFQVKAKLSDAFGNGVNTLAESIKVTYTGAGIVFGTLPNETDANGELTFSVLLGSNDTGSVNVTVQYNQNGDEDFTDAKDLTTVGTTAITASGVVAASSDTKVNVGTFSGKLVVYAQNAAGSEVSYKIAGKWVTQVVTSDLLMRYDRVVGATGKTIKVDIYVDGVLKLAKSVVTK